MSFCFYGVIETYVHFLKFSEPIVGLEAAKVVIASLMCEARIKKFLLRQKVMLLSPQNRGRMYTIAAADSVYE
jgi:hypothetical protein